MIRRIEVRTFDEALGTIKHYYAEHLKQSNRHKKMLCGLNPNKGVRLTRYDMWSMPANLIMPCVICTVLATDNHKFLADRA